MKFCLGKPTQDAQQLTAAQIRRTRTVGNESDGDDRIVLVASINAALNSSSRPTMSSALAYHHPHKAPILFLAIQKQKFISIFIDAVNCLQILSTFHVLFFRLKPDACTAGGGKFSRNGHHNRGCIAAADLTVKSQGAKVGMEGGNLHVFEIVSS